MKRILASLLVALPVAAASAAEGSLSEYFYQAEAGKQDFTPKLTYSTMETEYTGASSLETSIMLLSLEYEYGLRENVSIGGAIGYGTGDYELGTTEGDIKGMTDLTLFTKAHHAVGSGLLRFGAELEVALEDNEQDGNDVNLASGGMALYPYIGYEMAHEDCVWGAKLTVPVELKDETTDTNGTKSESKGGQETELAVFWEHKMGEAQRIGLALEYNTVSDVEPEAGGEEDQISPIYRLQVYMPTQLGEGTLLPQLTYGMSTDDDEDGTELDGYTELALAVGYRMMF